ncbi:DJ-1/PfpI family protein [Sphingobium chungbukense]|uniref:Dimethyladenosine transferase n=1 Tax=Sphingobium chungbukense TaxID=56193 RepID=A0A0M3AN81_9SPHN|nr:DJ-1/PfpI family protein [Sphingobium chungbukense]KKW90391.1 dimethyladenosine transferase [Sphingobium chungbukense]
MTKRVLLLLADGFEPLEAAGFTDVLGWANIDGEEPIELVSAGLRSPLKATFGFSVIPQALVGELDLDSFDAVAVPGGFEGAGFYEDALSQRFSDIIRRFSDKQQPVASVCVASLSLGAAGVLKGRRATIYHQIGGKRRAQLEHYGAKFVDEAVVVDGMLITSTGPGTAIEVAFELLTVLTSQENSNHIRKLMRIPEPAASWRGMPQVSTI